jgi:hypothetical protein
MVGIGWWGGRGWRWRKGRVPYVRNKRVIVKLYKYVGGLDLRGRADEGRRKIGELLSSSCIFASQVLRKEKIKKIQTSNFYA